jgi:hypothetical protein
VSRCGLGPRIVPAGRIADLPAKGQHLTGFSGAAPAQKRRPCGRLSMPSRCVYWQIWRRPSSPTNQVPG